MTARRVPTLPATPAPGDAKSEAPEHHKLAETPNQRRQNHHKLAAHAQVVIIRAVHRFALRLQTPHRCCAPEILLSTILPMTYLHSTCEWADKQTSGSDNSTTPKTACAAALPGPSSSLPYNAVGRSAEQYITLPDAPSTNHNYLHCNPLL